MATAGPAAPIGGGPFDQMSEMINIACTDSRLKPKLAAELGGVANPMILLPLAGIFLAFFGADWARHTKPPPFMNPEAKS